MVGPKVQTGSDNDISKCRAVRRGVILKSNSCAPTPKYHGFAGDHDELSANSRRSSWNISAHVSEAIGSGTWYSSSACRLEVMTSNPTYQGIGRTDFPRSGPEVLEESLE